MHVDPNSQQKPVNESSASQLPQMQHEPKSGDGLCPSFMRDYSYMKDGDSSAQLPSMQKGDSSVFSELSPLPKLAEAEHKPLFPLSVEREMTETIVTIANQETNAASGVVAHKEELKQKCLIPQEGYIEQKVERKIVEDRELSHEVLNNNSKEQDEESESVEESKGGKSKVRKKPYTAEEDRLILHYVKCFGEKNWRKIAELIPGRNRKQLRDHYVNFLKNKISKREFTEKEDSVISAMVAKHGHAWKKIADKLPGRTPIMVKNRYHSKLGKKAASSKDKGRGLCSEEGVKESSCDNNDEDSISSISAIIKDVTKEIKRLRIPSQ